MRTSLALSLVLCSFLGAETAFADSFTVLPNGRVVFNVSVTTRGVFTCLGSIPCTGSGTSSIVVGSGTNTTTLTFNGVSNTPLQVRDSSQQVHLGAIQATAANPGFTFPTRRNPNMSIIRFTLFLTQDSRDHFGEPWGFGPGGRSTVPFLRATDRHAAFRINSNPPGFHYTDIVYSFAPFPFSMPSSGVREIGAKVGAIPEPATLFLLGGGLAGAALARRRRRGRDTLAG